MKFDYQRRYIPTGLVTQTVIDCKSEFDFLCFLNRWNMEDDGWAVYTAVDRSLHKPTEGCVEWGGNKVVIQEAVRDMDDITLEGGYWQPIIRWLSKSELERIRTRKKCSNYTPE